MEVLKKDFEASLPAIREVILDADFISIDAEFTGLSTPDVRFNNTDDLQQRYHKVQQHVQAFTIVQYGVCAFKKTNTGYVAKPFNFYVFGGDNNNVQSYRTFLSSASSLSFLRSNHFDFNKLIDEGIPFYNYAEERNSYTANGGWDVISRHQETEDSNLGKYSRLFLEPFRKNLTNWLQEGATTPLNVPTQSGTHKKLVYQEIQQGRYAGYLKGVSKDSRSVQVIKVKSEDRFAKSSRSPALNFRHVIEAIKEADCPVVIHNGLYDICHTVDQFWHNLPDSIRDFKELVTSMWQNVVDTKYMAEFHPILRNCFNTSVLGSLYNTVEEELRNGGHIIRMGDGFERYSAKGSPNSSHEAGYDAYMTGVIYLGFIYYVKEKEEEERLKKDKNNITNGVDATKNETSTTTTKEPIFMDDSVTPYYNKIFVMRCDMPYIDLQDKETMHGNVQRNRFFLNDIPSGLTHTGIEKLLPEICPTSITWVNDNMAWLTVLQPNKIDLAPLGKLGLDRVRDFMEGGARFLDGQTYQIGAKAADMTLLSGEQWETLGLGTTTTTTTTTTQADSSSTTSSTVPMGASSYDDLDIPLPPSFRSAKRAQSPSTEDRNTKKTKN
ncbi:CAF1 family ribonuclease-domain-containing protein [Chlamydoabsidia padenii]|nr:CAF1 family ribonuclease-domain-containing protein [Chlamydoabsidia padenii]